MTELTFRADFRALCAELYAAIQLYTGLNPYAANMPPNEVVSRLMEAMAASAAALGQSKPQGPTNDQAEDLADTLNLMDGYAEHEDGFFVRASNLGSFARAVLAHFGRPTIEPVLVAERLPCAEDCDTEGRCWFHSTGRTWKDWYYLKASWATETETHWLPWYALPVPQQEAE